MSILINCDHSSYAPLETLLALPIREQGIARWKCAVCAYELGFNKATDNAYLDIKDYLSNVPREQIHECPDGNRVDEALISNIEISQKGIVKKQQIQRHRCPVCAFTEGFKAALELKQLQSGGGAYKGIEELPPSGVTLQLKVNANPSGGIPQAILDKKNKFLGDLGEQLVINHEVHRLRELKLFDYADKVEWAAKKEGDHLGYDVRSFFDDGSEKYIEVKTTTGNSKTPFHISINQLNKSKEYPENYCLFRIYKLNIKNLTFSFYNIYGSLEENLTLLPVSFLAAPE